MDNYIQDSFVLSYVRNPTGADGEHEAILIVGRKSPGKAPDIVNAFTGMDATLLYKRLITPAKAVTDEPSQD